MEYKKYNGTWVIVLKKDDKIIEKLSEFIDAEQVKGGYMYGIGAVSSVEIAHYDLSEKKYSSKTFEEPLELLSLLGDVAFKDGEKIVHCHVENMATGVHNHLLPQEGDMDLGAYIGALAEAGFTGGLALDLYSYDYEAIAPGAIEYLRGLIEAA